MAKSSGATAVRTSAYPAFQVLFRPVVALQTDSPLQDQGMLRLCPLLRRVRQGAASFNFLLIRNNLQKMQKKPQMLLNK